jgi:spermidine synthase
MLGLGLGSWLGGKYIDILSKKTNIKSAVFYGLSEILIGTGAVLIPLLFSIGQKLLLATGQTNSVTYMLLSALLLGITMLPWCIAMGTTFPFMMSFIKQTPFSEKSSFSFLYTANVIGSVVGVLFAVIYAIEIFGLNNTLYITCVINLLIASCAFYISRILTKQPARQTDAVINVKTSHLWKIEISPVFLKIILFITGFVSLGLEIAWTRVFSPALGTMVYAFSFLLAGYLLATYLGTLLYRKHIKNGKILSLGFLLSALAVSSFLPIVINDPNLLSQGVVVNTFDITRIYKFLIQITLTIFPVCMVLGYLTPSIIDYYSQGDEKKAGTSYAINVLGCILGPLAVSYILLPLISTKAVMIIMSMLYIGLFVLFMNKVSKFLTSITLLLVGAFLFISVFYTTTYEFPFLKTEFKNQVTVYRDATATVHAYKYDKHEAVLLVNGFGMTGLSTITKMMAHIPLAIHENPKSGLVICFGMGTTYRSMLSWGIETTAVELTPGVVKSFPIFHEDANAVLNDPKGEIIIDDGRRYVMRTNKKFDVITIDPPPPVEASASALLYSRDFYKIIKMKLNEGGILQHWIPFEDFSQLSVLRAIIKSITEEFPYVQYYVSIEGWGIHITASMSPIKEFSPQELNMKTPEAAKNDLTEWAPENSSDVMYKVVLERKVSVKKLLEGWTKKEIITDSHPYNEYFLLREAELF